MAQMTCQAGIRVLKELAGCTWEQLDEELRFPPGAGTCKRISTRNDNWPRTFGSVDYSSALVTLAQESSNNLYAAAVTVRTTLQKNDAYTPEVAVLLESVDHTTSEEELETRLSQAGDLIYQTATPRSRARQGSAALACGQGAECVSNEAGVLKETAACADHANVIDTGKDAFACADRIAEALAGKEREAQCPVASPAPAQTPAGKSLSFGDVRRLLTGGTRRVIMRSFATDEALMRELLGAQLVGLLASPGVAKAAAEGHCPQAVRDEVAGALTCDEGLLLRGVLTRCEALMRTCDAAAFAAGCRDLLPARGLQGVPTPARPAYLADPLGWFDTHFRATPASRLLALTLIALLGTEGAAQVLHHYLRTPGLLAGRI